MIEAHAGTFKEEVLDSKGPVLVDFWAPWCGPCRTIAPMIQELSDDNKDTAKVVKINIEHCAATLKLAGDYGVEAIPTLLIFKDGQVVRAFTGVPKKAVVQEALDAAKL